MVVNGIGDRIKLIRKTIGNQVTFAAMMGITHQYVSKGNYILDTTTAI